VSIRLLGDGVVEQDGLPVQLLTTPRVLRLFARLALAPSGRLDRRRLAYDLWPGSSEGQSLTNLRKVLHDVRQAAGVDELLCVDHRAVSWCADAADRVDVVQLRDAIDAADGARVACLYRGDLLPSCYDDWLLAERDRLRDAAWVAIEAAAHAATDPSDRLALARTLLSIDPLREPGYQLAMRALAALGQRAEALRTYHRCVEVLERELDVDPDNETLDLYDEIRAGATGVSTTRPSRSGPATTTLVGRDAELAQLDAAWQRAIGGAAQVALVTGEAGIGKSRLIAELAHGVAASGLPVVATRAYEAAGGLPWAPVTDWLRADAIATRVHRLEAPWGTELARLLPELRSRHQLSEPVADGGPSGRRVLFDALVRVVAGSEAPLLLVLDDLQWCDENTIEFIGYLVSRASAAPILIAATARSEDLAVNERAGSVLTDVARDARLTEIELGRLDADSTAQIAAELCARTIDAADGRRLWEETEGNPLFTVELARAGWSGQRTAVGMPPTMRAVIATRLGKLTPPARDIAEVASTVGRAFSMPVVARAAGTDEDALVDGLDELWRRQVIREHGHGYDFTHDKLREVLHRSIAPARARRLHRQVAAALTAIHADDLGPVSALIAAQLAGAGQSAEAIEAYRRAADHALGLLSLDEATDCLERALQCLGGLAPGAERDSIELRLRQALVVPVMWSAGYGSDHVVNAWERVIALCRRMARPVDPALLRGLGGAHLTRCDFRRSAAFAGELLATAGDDVVTLVEGHYLMGVSQFWRGDLASSQRHLDHALRLYSREHTAEHVARFTQDPRAVCLVRLGQTRLWQGHPEEARELLARGRAHGEDVGHPGTLIYVHNYIQMTAIELGDLDLAERCSTELQQLIEGFGGPSLRWFDHLHRLLAGCMPAARGDAGALESLTEIVDDWRSATQTLQFTFGLLALGRGHADGGDLDAGHAAVREALLWAEAHDQHYLDAPLWLAEGELRECAHDRMGASAARRNALAIARQQGAGWYTQQANAALDDSAQ
jgi:DNA-binding SARP family transcriptional activator